MSRAGESLDDVIAEYLEALDAGLVDSPVQFADNHPELKTEFLRFLRLAVKIEQQLLPGQANVPGSAITTNSATDESSHIESGEIFGDFQIVRPIGVGGVGVVYLAQERTTQHLVALKTLRQSLSDDPTYKQRFQREIQAIDALHHEHIVPLIASGVERGIAFLAIKLIDGLTVNSVVFHTESPSRTNTETESTRPTTQTTPRTSTSAAACYQHFVREHDYFAAVANLGANVANALQSAHAIGIVHRDVKPSNILLDVNGKAWLTDFGLAAFAEDFTALTLTGDVVGTPAYMSPEQAIGANDLVDHRTDIYSLGATLFELASGRKPFLGSRHQILMNVAQGKLPSMRALRHDIPHALEAVILKAMALSPEERYDSAGDMERDLRRFARGESVNAKLPGWHEKLFRWSERNPWVALVSVLGIVASIVVAFAVQGVYSNRLFSINKQLAHSNEQLQQTNRRLETREQQLQQQLYVSDMSLAFTAYADGNIPSVRQVLEPYDQPANAGDLRGFGWYLLNQLTAAPRATELAQHADAATEVDVFPDGRRGISVGHDGQAHVFDMEAPNAAQRPVQKIIIGGQLDAVAVSVDGNSFVTGMNVPEGFNSVRRYDVDSGSLAKQIEGHWSSVESAAVSASGKLFATAGRYRDLQIRDAAGNLQRQITTDSRNESLAFLGDDRHVAAVVREPSSAEILRVWDLQDGSTQDLDFGFSPKTFAASSIKLSSDKISVVAAGIDNIAVVQWPSNQRLASKQDLVGRIRCVAISPSGQSIAAGCDQGTVLVWDVNDVNESAELPDPRVIHASQQRITSIKMVPGNQLSQTATLDEPLRILTSSEDGRVCLWQMPRKIPVPINVIDSLNQNTGVEAVWAASSHASELYLRLDDGTVAVLNDQLELRRIATVPRDKIGSLVASDESQTVIVAASEDIVLLNAITGEVVHRLPKPFPDQSCADFLLVNAQLLALFYDHLVVWDLESRRRVALHTLPTDSAIQLLQLPGTQSILIVTQACIYRLEDGELSIFEAAETAASNYRRIELSQSGKMLALAQYDHTIRLRSLADTSPSILLQGHKREVKDCLFTDDDQTLISASAHGEIHFWNIATGRELGHLQSPCMGSSFLHYFPGIRTLVSASPSQPLELWPATGDR